MMKPVLQASGHYLFVQLFESFICILYRKTQLPVSLGIVEQLYVASDKSAEHQPAPFSALFSALSMPTT